MLGKGFGLSAVRLGDPVTLTAPLELISPALPRVREEHREDPPGWGGVTVFYGDHEGPAKARLLLRAKLRARDLGEGRGILATGELDATIGGVTALIDVMSSRLPRADWMSDLNRLVDERNRFS